uniref:Transposase n=1 Tax=Ascaris lumbricoides TaxID=6252 RepID=A0A0M3IPA4_ASCLU
MFNRTVKRPFIAEDSWQKLPLVKALHSESGSVPYF